MAKSEILKKIESRFGREIRYSQECEALSEAIFEVTGERLGITTLKRMFGLVGEKVVPRKSTMDIIAQYTGYSDYSGMLKDMGDDTQLSAFTPVDGIDVSELEDGTQVQIAYRPNRLLIMTYLGDFRFIINESHNSKVVKGDTLKITHLNNGFELVVLEVVRDGVNLGQYVAAKDGGITTIEIIN